MAKEKILAHSRYTCLSFTCGSHRLYRGYGCSPLHLHDLLMMKILGISAFYHDSAAALIVDGKIIAAAQEERFTRKKHDSSYPFHAIEFVLNYSKIQLSEVDNIVFFEKPFLKFERLLETYMAFAPSGFKSFSFAMPIWLREKLFQKKFLFEKLRLHDEKFNDINKIYGNEVLARQERSLFYQIAEDIQETKYLDSLDNPAVDPINYTKTEKPYIHGKKTMFETAVREMSGTHLSETPWNTIR